MTGRQALLNANSAIRQRYFGVSDPLTVFGLPVSRVEDMGNHYAIRTQRAVFQQWKEAVPWAAAGQVTIANGGDIGKELGWLTSGLQPEPAPEPGTPIAPWEVQTLLVGLGEPALLWALQTNQTVPETQPYARLLLSTDNGAGWQEFGGGLPMKDNCLRDVSLDYATPTTLYASTCRGTYRWDGGAWQFISSQPTVKVVVTYGNPSVLWAIRYPDGAVIRSNDGGATWQAAGNGLISFAGVANLGIDPRNNQTLYAIIAPRYAGSYLRRGTADGQWTTMPTPENNSTINTGMSIDGATGDLYVTTNTNSVLWRSRNPNTSDVNGVVWEKVHQFDTNVSVELMASGSTSQGLVLYANLRPPSDVYTVSSLYRSLDGGHTRER